MTAGDHPLPAAIGARYAPGYPYTPAWWLHAMRPFAAPPTLLVWHSGATGDDLCRYLADPVAKPHARGAVLCQDGRWRRQVGTHFASTTANGDYRQMIPLDVAAWGVRGYNDRSIHIEAPAHRGPELDRQSRDLASMLVQVVPSLERWSCHRWVSGSREDPICWTDAEVVALMSGVGLEMFRP